MSQIIAENETKNQKFVRLAEHRVNLILKELHKLGNLSNTRNYEYTDEQVKMIFSELRRTLNKTQKLFTENSNSQPKKFVLKG